MSVTRNRFQEIDVGQIFIFNFGRGEMCVLHATVVVGCMSMVLDWCDGGCSDNEETSNWSNTSFAILFVGFLRTLFSALRAPRLMNLVTTCIITVVCRPLGVP